MSEGRHRRPVVVRGRGLVRGAVTVLGGVAMGTASPALAHPVPFDVSGAPSAEVTAASVLRARAAELNRRAEQARTTYQQAIKRAAELRAAAVRTRAAADQAIARAQRLHDDVAGTAPGGVVESLLDDQGELDEAVAAAKAQQAAMTAADDADRDDRTARTALLTAKQAWTDAAARAARMQLRIEAEDIATKSLQLATFSSAYQVDDRLQDLRNRSALENWRAYLSALAAARVVPPKAAELADPARLPAGLDPVLTADGKAVPGVGQVWRVGAEPLVVLPAETIRAVSAAFTRIGTPDADDGAPDPYACGGFTADVWRTAGFKLPTDSTLQWRRLGRGQRLHPQVGDLVYLGDGHFGINRAGIFVGGRLWIAVDSRTGTAGVEVLPDTGVFAVRRATLPRPDPVTLALPMTPTWTRTGCGEAKPPPPATAEGGIDRPGPTTGGGGGKDRDPSSDTSDTSDTPVGSAWTLPIPDGLSKLSAEFGETGGLWSGAHTGQDFAAPIGTPVRAAYGGVVSVEHPEWAGTLIRIRHGNGVESWYAHLSAATVRPSQVVAAGALIGAVGTKGNSTGPHLHFEIRIDDRPVDPLPLLFPSTAMARWGGHRNGEIPASALCPIGTGDTRLLRCDAAVAFRLLDAAYRDRFGRGIAVSGGYRSLTEQQAVFAAKPNLAAVPGTSNHGWGLAVDLAGGIDRFGTPQHRWLVANAPRFGWRHPGWARQGGSRPEPWHFEFGSIS